MAYPQLQQRFFNPLGTLPNPLGTLPIGLVSAATPKRPPTSARSSSSCLSFRRRAHSASCASSTRSCPATSGLPSETGSTPPATTTSSSRSPFEVRAARSGNPTPSRRVHCPRLPRRPPAVRRRPPRRPHPLLPPRIRNRRAPRRFRRHLKAQ